MMPPKNPAWPIFWRVAVSAIRTTAPANARMLRTVVLSVRRVRKAGRTQAREKRPGGPGDGCGVVGAVLGMVWAASVAGRALCSSESLEAPIAAVIEEQGGWAQFEGVT
jgi:hypothetical protein